MKSLTLVLVSCVLSANAFAASQKHKVAQPEGSVNIRMSPIGFIFGLFSASADFRINDSATIGPLFSYGSGRFSDAVSTSWGLGVRASFSVSNRVFHDGWYLSPFATYYRFDFNYAGDQFFPSSDVAFNFLDVGGIGGYAWFWRSGFNITLGLGASVSVLNADVTGPAASHVPVGFSGVMPAGDFSLGWVF